MDWIPVRQAGTWALQWSICIPRACSTTAGPFDSRLWKDNQWMACNGAPPEITDCNVLTGTLTWEVFFFPSRRWIPALSSDGEEELINISLEKWRQADMSFLSEL